MDMHRQQLKPSYQKVRMVRAEAGHGLAGKRSNNSKGRPPSLTGEEDRSYFRMAPMSGSTNTEGMRVHRYQFNRFMRQIIMRDFNNLLAASGGKIISPGKFDAVKKDRIHGPSFRLETKTGEITIRVTVEKRMIYIRAQWDMETLTPVRVKRPTIEWDSFTASPAVLKYPKGWTVFNRNFNGDVSMMIEPDAVWANDKEGNASRLFALFRKFLLAIKPDCAEMLKGIPERTWKF